MADSERYEPLVRCLRFTVRTPMIDAYTLLLCWYRANGRDLPWRHTRDPYKILVSEVMLQQTQAARVIDFYGRWIKRFPNWMSLARAKTDALIHAWAGLGYNRRALYMREVARAVVKDGVPRTVEGWLRLKGIGPYAAAAIYVFSEHQPAAAIDTNIRRVAGRVCLGKKHSVPADDKRILRAFNATFLRPSGYEILHALMDLGATICSSRQPNCAHCPLRTCCKAAFSFSEPKKKKKRRVQKPKEHVHPGKAFPDRIYRGRILSLVRKKKNVRIKDICPLVDERYHASRDAKWMNAMLERMVRDGLLHKRASTVSLPKT